MESTVSPEGKDSACYWEFGQKVLFLREELRRLEPWFKPALIKEVNAANNHRLGADLAGGPSTMAAEAVLLQDSQLYSPQGGRRLLDRKILFGYEKPIA